MDKQLHQIKNSHIKILVFHKSNQILKQKLYNITIMGLTISTDILNIIGIVYSGLAVFLAVSEVFVKGKHSRALDCIQWAYFLSITSTAVQFSSYLNVGSSLITLNADALANFYCTLGNYVCNRPFSLSFIVILTGVLVILRLISIPQKVREKGLFYTRLYSIFKGLIKWVYLPLVVLSLNYLINGNSQIIPAVVVLAVLAVFPIAQVILYKFFDQKEVDPMVKWLEFANYVKALLFSLLVNLAVKYGTAYYYYLSLVLVVYAALFAIYYQFLYERAGRVIYISGEVIFYFLYSLYVSGSTWLADYFIDLFGLGIIIVIDIVYLIMQSKIVYSQWKNTKTNEIIPQGSVNQEPNKKNRYNVDDGLEGFDPSASKNQLTDSNVLKNSKNGRVKPKK